MTRELKLKPRFEQTVRRFDAWWRGEVIDRPPLTLPIKPARPYEGPTSQHATERDRWLDAEFQVASMTAGLRQHDYPADNLPVLQPNVGPELTAALLGCELDFLTDRTSWSKPIIDHIDQWHDIIGRPLDFQCPGWQAIEQITDLAIAANNNEYLVGITDLHDNYDTMAALRDPQALCMDLMDDEQLIERVGRDLTRVLRETYTKLWKKIEPMGLGASTWTRAHFDGPWYLPSCDFWCMINDEQARKLVLPDVISEMSILERSLFHLDGPQALRHLDLLLEIPQLDAVQWVYGAGNGPGTRWIDVYRRIVAAGKSSQVFATSPQDAMDVLEAVGPDGLWLCVTESVMTNAEADAFIKELEQAVTRLRNRGRTGWKKVS